jgi:hypothetical protein
MSKSDEEKPGATALQGAKDTIERAGAAALAASMSAADPREALVRAAIAGSAVTVLSTAKAWWNELIDARQEQWWQHVAKNVPPDDLSDIVEHQIHQDPRKKSAILESLRALSQALDDAVIPALAALTAEYLREGKSPDAFFRGTARLLTDISAEELNSLRSFVRALIEAEYKGPSFEVHYLPTGYDGKDIVRLKLPNPDEKGQPMYEVLKATMPYGLRLFSLLKTQHLGRDNLSGFYDVASGPQVLWIERDVVYRLGGLLK